MISPRHVLILTADAGFGHRSAALAVAAALEEVYADRCHIDVVNPLEDKRAPFFLRDGQSDYDKMVRDSPELYRFGYDASDAVVPGAILESASTVFLYELMSDLLKTYRPDAILTTYPFYQAPLVSNFSINRYYIPLLTAVTDLVSIHRIWFNKYVDACLVPNSYVRDLALAFGLPKDKIYITGIPVHPDVIKEKRDKETIRASLGWRTDLPTFLAVGSRRVERLIETLQALNHFGAPIQLIVVAGKDDQLFQHAQEIDWHVPVKIYEYATNIPTMMHASDGLICKAGGLIVTEALACSLPMMLIDIIPGQESGNAEYVLEGGAADLAESPLEALEVMAHWMMDDRKLLKERALNSARLGKPNSAYKAADLIWKAAERGPVSKKGRRIAGRPRLVELLTNNHVRWQDNSLNNRKK
ncbi:MAG TPA: glycosyltransferase [Anaerolineaceae bacterium]|nr:glycosyltransferase [Anaerolineaceae bacterium]